MRSLSSLDSGDAVHDATYYTTDDAHEDGRWRSG